MKYHIPEEDGRGGGWLKTYYEIKKNSGQHKIIEKRKMLRYKSHALKTKKKNPDNDAAW